MKLFKIIFLSIISIFIFQSQLYGINLSCDFKKRINTRYFNYIVCTEDLDELTTQGKNFKVCYSPEDEMLSGWIYKLLIEGKSGVILNKWSDHFIKFITDTEGSPPKSRGPGNIIIKVIHEVNDIFKSDGIQNKNSYLVTLENDLFGIYTLYFDSLSKKSILTNYQSMKSIKPNSDKRLTWTTTLWGKCEKIE